MPILSGPGDDSDVVYDIRIDWDGDGDFTTDGDDVTTRTLERGSFAAEYGRDQARSLSPTASGRASLEIDNTSRDYSPDNIASPLAGRIRPARPLRIRATRNGIAHTLMRGHLDDYEVQPAPGERSVAITALDPVAMLKGAEISTQLHKGVRTGEAIGLVLDAIGWPEDARDLDLGATIIRWWWAEGEDAFDAITKIVASEGPPAILHADELGRIVFRDRHHRLLDEESITAQATFTDVSTGEPAFSDYTYDHGWRDIVNSVTISVEERDPSAELESVWESADVRSIPASTTVTLQIQANDPVINPAVSYTTLAGTVTSAITQESGQALTLELTAGGSAAAVSEIVVSARPVTVQRTYQVKHEDPSSAGEYGLRSLPHEAPWAGVHDADAIAALIVGARAQRLPIVTMTLVAPGLVNGDRIDQQLTRNLSDRVHVREPESCVDYDFFVDQIKHRSLQAGAVLETEFGLEKAATQAADVFRFDDADHGFDDGVFGASGLDDPELLFLFDVDGHGFDDGVFAT